MEVFAREALGVGGKYLYLFSPYADLSPRWRAETQRGPELSGKTKTGENADMLLTRIPSTKHTRNVTQENFLRPYFSPKCRRLPGFWELTQARCKKAWRWVAFGRHAVTIVTRGTCLAKSGGDQSRRDLMARPRDRERRDGARQTTVWD